MSIVTRKEYYCPVCGNKEMHTTNHFQEIYCKCKICGNNPLYYGNPKIHELAYKDITYIQAILHYYYYDLNSACDYTVYNKLVNFLQKNNKYSVFVSNGSCACSDIRFRALKKHDGKKVTLYNPLQFDNQFVSNVGRVFKWKEAMHPNKRIKEGYYLEFI